MGNGARMRDVAAGDGGMGAGGCRGWWLGIAWW
jgi:hypothetical protein